MYFSRFSRNIWNAALLVFLMNIFTKTCFSSKEAKSEAAVDAAHAPVPAQCADPTALSGLEEKFKLQQNENQILKAKVEEMKSAHQKVKEEAGKLASEARDKQQSLEVENRTLRESLQANEAEFSKLKANAESLSQELASANEKVKEKGESLQASKAEFSKLKANAELLSQELASAKEKSNEHASALEEAKNKDKERENLQNKIQELERSLEAAGETAEKAKMLGEQIAQLKAAEKERDRLQNEVQALQNRLEAAAEAAEKVKQLGNEVEKLKTAEEEKLLLQKQNTELSQKLAKGEEKAAEAKLLQEKEADKLKKIEKERVKLQKQVTKAKQQVATLEERVKQLENPEPLISVFLNDAWESFLWLSNETMVQIQIIGKWLHTTLSPRISQASVAIHHGWAQVRAAAERAWAPLQPHYSAHLQPHIDPIIEKVASFVSQQISVIQAQLDTAVYPAIKDMSASIAAKAIAMYGFAADEYRDAIVSLKNNAALPSFVRKNAATLVRSVVLIVVIVLLWLLGGLVLRLCWYLLRVAVKGMLWLMYLPFLMLWAVFLYAPARLFKAMARGSPKPTSSKNKKKASKKKAKKPHNE